jgi:hypothetical protein
LTFHGISSASNSSHDVPNSSNRPAASAAARTWSTRVELRIGAKKGRPVLVHTAPTGPGEEEEDGPAKDDEEEDGPAKDDEEEDGPAKDEDRGSELEEGKEREGAGKRSELVTPKRDCASSGERQTSSTAREPMCFSWHTTEVTPSAR